MDDCCIVGGGPAGMLLALLFARQGLRVTLLEAQHDFERDFRGNTLNPAALEMLNELGLVERVLALRHAKIPRFNVVTADGTITFADFARLPTRFPFIAMLPQAAFLSVLAQEIEHFPNARVVMGASVRGLITEASIVRGVRYRTANGESQLRAMLTIGADGRFSTVRKLAGMQLLSGNAPIDVLWFRLPRQPEDPSETEGLFRFGGEALLALMDHGDSWQVGYIMAKGGYKRLQTRGFPAFQHTIAELLPELATRVAQLGGWQDCALLPVESSRVRRWHKPGLLLLGDAAHVMSPVGGVGINCALQDAWTAAQTLAKPLRSGTLSPAELRMVQRRREWPTRLIQAGQHFAHRQVVDGALVSQGPFRIPGWIRLGLQVPFIGSIPARLIAFGGLGLGR